MPPTFLFDYFGFARLAMKGEQMTTDSRGYRHFSLSPNHAEGHEGPHPNHTYIGRITDKGEGHRKEDMRHTAVQTANTSHGFYIHVTVLRNRFLFK